MNRRAAFQLVLANPRLRRVVVAFAAFNLADWARWLAVLLYAYEHGGAATAGAVSLAQLVPAAIVAPIGAVLGDRYPRERLLLASYVLQAALMLTTALVVLADGPSIAVYGLAILGACAITLTRPAHGALLPGLASTPAELTAANAVSATAEGFGVLAGQAAAGLVVQFAGVAAALGVAGSIIALGAALVIGVRVLPAVAAATRSPDPAPAPPAVRGSMLRDLAHELGGGIDAVIRLGGPRTIVLLFGSTDLVWGALDILVVVLVLDVLSSGEGLVGILNALTGLGGLAGSAVALALVGRVRLARPFAVGLLAWGIPLAVIGLVPGAIVAGVLLAIAGAGRTVMDVTGRTLLQRTTPDASLSRVLGVLEGVFMAAFGLGSIVVAGLIDAAGPQAAFVVVGLVLPLAVAVAWRSLVTIDRTSVVPVRGIALLRGIPMFAALEPPIVERLASHLEPVTAAAGTGIIRQGDRGDRYYIVATGTVDVTIDGRHVRTDGPGSGFGEIALLRDIPRTASVTARTDVELLVLGRGAFLAAVTGDRAASRAADEVVTDRIGPARSPTPGGAGRTSERPGRPY